jgi:hypothetical protein
LVDSTADPAFLRFPAGAVPSATALPGPSFRLLDALVTRRSDEVEVEAGVPINTLVVYRKTQMQPSSRFINVSDALGPVALRRGGEAALSSSEAALSLQHEPYFLRHGCPSEGRWASGVHWEPAGERTAKSKEWNREFGWHKTGGTVC